MARHVAFFRNLNQGQRGSPTRAQLLTAFERARATDVEPFQGNGTILFTASAPARTRDQVVSWLIHHTDWCDIAPVRSAGWVHELASRLDRVDGHAELSVYDGRDFHHDLPWRPHDGHVTVVQADRRHAIVVEDAPRTSYATPVLERLLGVRVTSRGAPTILRLARHLA